MDLDEVAKHARTFLESIGIDPRKLESHVGGSITVPYTKALKRGREVFEPLEEESIRDKLSSDVLSIEIGRRFPELIKVRESVILRSHCHNHDVIFDSKASFEDMPVNNEDCLVIANGIKLENIDHLKAIIAGMRNKRLNVLKGGKRVKDDPYRVNFLLILTLCWTISGADLKEQEILESGMNDVMIKTQINLMEEVIGNILSEFIFLRYKECEFGNVL